MSRRIAGATGRSAFPPADHAEGERNKAGLCVVSTHARHVSVNAIGAPPPASSRQMAAGSLPPTAFMRRAPAHEAVPRATASVEISAWTHPLIVT